MFLVIGITGNTGAAAARTLLDAGERVRALVRSPAKAAHWAARGVELVSGDVAWTSDLVRAMQGTKGAYALVPPDYGATDFVGRAVATARAIREAAEAAALPRLVFLSSEGAHLPTGTGVIESLHAAEQALAGIGVPLTILRATYFLENFAPVFGVAAAEGVLPTMLTDLDRPQRIVAAADIGRVAAELLTAERAPALVELAGPRDETPRAVAATVAEIVGRPVQPVVPPREAWEGILREAGLGADGARLLAAMYDGINAEHVRFSGDVPLTRGRIGIAETARGWRGAAAAA
ncbi:NmrA family NAD(P)-binding protein [Salinarimonas ramus]|uniref:NmrA family transcriptional regulator n=1 Tax=Salinarimonas ramus TaxID=690164 RepID=A0A917V9X2_9HYPH|nr:NmrA family NAD(P)-binding protein [Salinarimonas ramus]GGK52939.1 NmrA family transcriptional regulator [Salinarimonas ramus]